MGPSTVIPLDDALAEVTTLGLELQIAAARTANCQVFLTNDKALKRVEAVRVLVLNELEFKPVISD